MGNLAATSHGACMVIPAPGFDPALTLEGDGRRQCTSLYGVPTMFIAEWGMTDFPVLRPVERAHGDHGRLELPRRDDEEAHRGRHRRDDHLLRHDRDLTGVDPDAHGRLLRTQGRHGRPRRPHVEIRIVDPITLGRCPAAYRGVLDQGLLGDARLLGQDDKTAEAIVDGWMRTGDLGVMDDDGYVQITGRIKDMVIRGGENVYPREIEEFLYTHPDILDAQVVGCRTRSTARNSAPGSGEGAPPLDAGAVREFATGKLAHYKIPRYVKIVDDFPMTVTGKVRKVEMRQQSTEELGLG